MEKPWKAIGGKGPFSGTMASSAMWVSWGGTEERLPPQSGSRLCPHFGEASITLWPQFPQLPLRLEVRQVLRVLPTLLPSLESRASQQDARPPPTLGGFSPACRTVSLGLVLPPQLGWDQEVSHPPLPQRPTPPGWAVWTKCPRSSGENSGCL